MFMSMELVKKIIVNLNEKAAVLKNVKELAPQILQTLKGK